MDGFPRIIIRLLLAIFIIALVFIAFLCQRSVVLIRVFVNLWFLGGHVGLLNLHLHLRIVRRDPPSVRKHGVAPLIQGGKKGPPERVRLR